MKKSQVVLGVLSVLMLSTPALARRSIVNAGEKYLPSCGGTIEVRELGNGQVNVIAREVENCSYFTLDNTGTTYPLQGSRGNMGGSFTIPSGVIQPGSNHISVDVHSYWGFSDDHLSFNVRGQSQFPTSDFRDSQLRGSRSPRDSQCRWAAMDAVRGAQSANLDRISNKGNYVYTVHAYGSRYEVTLDKGCGQISAPRQVSENTTSPAAIPASSDIDLLKGDSAATPAL